MAGQGFELEWRGRQALAAIRGEAQNRVTLAVEHVRDAILNKTLVGDRSGRLYRIPGTNSFYTASAPGESPASRLGGLRRSVATQVRQEGSRWVGEVGTPLDYGLFLELGTQRFAPRPWLRPTIESEQSKIEEILERQWML